MPQRRFSEMPNLGEFIRRAGEHGIRLKYSPPLADPPAWPSHFRYLQRDRYGAPIVVLPDWRDDKRLDQVTVENWCETLQLPGEDFGLESPY